MHFNAQLLHVVCQVFGHLLGQCRDEHTLSPGDTLANLCEQVVDLSSRGAHTDLRINQASGANHLFHDGFAMFVFIWARCGRNKECLVNLLLKLCKGQWPVIKCRGKAKAVIDKYLLA